MQKITTAAELDETIRLLEIKQKVEVQLFKEQVRATYESMKPINLVKSFLKNLTTSPEVGGSLVNSVMGIVGGYLSKKAVVGGTTSTFRQVLGSIIQMGVTNLISRNADGIKSTTTSVFQKIFGKKENTS